MLKVGLPVALVLLVVDQVSKFLLIDLMAQNPGGIEITSFFRLVMVWNSGVSFGMFAGGETTKWILIALSLVICAVLVGWLNKTTKRYMGVALGIVIGGALGNIIDRLLYGKVADFFDVDLIFMRWPAFNVADMAIVTGVFVLLLENLFFDRNSDRKETE